MKHKIVSYTNAFNFDAPANQIKIGGSSTTIARNIVATSFGRGIANSGTRIWDSSILPANSTQIITGGTDLILPFTSSFLPQYLFDAIVRVDVDGFTVPVGFSNSPDNIGVYPLNQPITDQNVFWLNLYCFGTNNSQGNNLTANHYMFGGNGAQFTVGKQIFMYFANPLTETLVVNYSLEYYKYAGGLHFQSIQPPVTLNPGQATYQIGAPNFVSDAYAATGQYLYNLPGYVKVAVTVDKPNYRSLLPFYHWGCA